jgi:Carbohydrate binding domain
MRYRHTLVALASLLAGCNIIDSSLLNSGRDAATPHDAIIDGDSDAPLDAYAPFAGNLVTNPGFESGSTNWANDGGGTIGLSTVETHTGTNSLATTARTGLWNGPAQSLLAKIRPGKQYTASVYARLVSPLTAPGPDSFMLSIKFDCLEITGDQFNTDNLRTPAPASDNTVWVHPTSMFMAPNKVGCTLTQFQIYVETTLGHCQTTTTTACTASVQCGAEICVGNDFYVDDFAVNEVP